MSYFCFMACSRELELGGYGLLPKTVYASYTEYMNSKDYHPRSFYPRIRDRLAAVGTVSVYESLREMSDGIYLRPFPEPSKWDDELKFIASQFSLPYLYAISDYNLDYMCKFLNPDDQIEYLSIFLGHGKPLAKPVVATIDLQDYVDGKLSEADIEEICYTPPDNNFVRFIPPQEPQVHLPIVRRDNPDNICSVCGNFDSEAWNYSKLHEQGLF